jgi:Spy/CpxP family protein refolding chaperone
MDAYSIAAELLGDLELSPDQRAQLRAIDYRYQLEVQQRLHARGGRETASLPPPAADRIAESGPAQPEDDASLRAMIVAAILELLTPQQRADLDRR